MTNQKLLLNDHLQNIYKQNAFVNLLEMKLIELEPGKAKLSMPVNKEIHTNLYKMVHGGALAALVDTAMGVACATTGKKVVTLDMNLNFIRGAESQQLLTGVGTLIHDGKQTMVAEAEVLDADNNLLVKARATFFVTGSFL
ncbi:Acyl-coenzyme A thioesterase PaaI [Sporomusa rhizae]|uniref:PaaI family thioesterase n=1 Tax=Sporomusa rhizae TaxID=357999 RepID=UPI00352B58C8